MLSGVFGALAESALLRGETQPALGEPRQAPASLNRAAEACRRAEDLDPVRASFQPVRNWIWYYRTAHTLQLEPARGLVAVEEFASRFPGSDPVARRCALLLALLSKKRRAAEDQAYAAQLEDAALEQLRLVVSLKGQDIPALMDQPHWNHLREDSRYLELRKVADEGGE